MAGGARAESAVSVVWRPQPGPQAALVKCPVEEILYGGARGGGKTDGMLGKFAIKADRYGAAAKGVFFRREGVQLEAAIARSKQIYGPLGAVWREQKKIWTFPNGATLKFRDLAGDAEAAKYQGHDYTDVFFEELTNWPSDGPILKLKAVLRSGAGVPCQMHATANPGGPGHQWVKARYIDPAPGGWKIIRDETGAGRVYIPARLSDNALLTKADPGYVGRLRQSGSEALVRAWLNGDWSVVEGAFFDGWATERHVIRPFTAPAHWLRFGSFDWGSMRPFSYGLWVVSDGGALPDGRRYPMGALIRLRELYGASGPNVGLRLGVEEVARRIRAFEGAEKIDYRVADPAIWKADGGPSHAERMRTAAGLTFRPADNARVAGWDQMRDRLAGSDDGPMLYVTSLCADFIRTFPALQHDKHQPEDIDSDGEDHAADEARYGCMSRPWTKPAPAAEQPIRGIEAMTINDLWAAQPRRNERV